MISLRRLLERDEGNDTASLSRACSLLIEAIALHAVQHDAPAYAEFRDAVRRHRRLTEAPNAPEAVLGATGQVIHSMESYNRDVETFIRIQTGEFQEMVRMLSRTLLEITRESAHAGENLSKIERELCEAAGLDDLRAVKGKLRESLQSISQESERQRDTARKVREGLHAHLQSIKSETHTIDAVTGLPNAAEAERKIEEALAAGGGAYVAALCIQRLDAINSRFGYAVGDRLMLQFAQDVAQRLSGTDALFRWRGPTLLAILRRPGGTHDIRIEVSRLAGQRQEMTVELNDRTVLLPVAARSTIVALEESPTIEDVLDRLNAFVAAAAGE